MARNFDGVFSPGSSDAAGRGGTASTTTSSGPSAMRIAAEFQFADAAVRCHEFAQLMAELDRGALVLQQLDRGLDQNRAQAVACDQRPAGLPARQQRFPHDRAGEARRALGRIDVERGQQQRLHQPLIQRAVAGDGVADELVGPCPDQRHQCRDNRAARYRGRGAPRRTPTAATWNRRDRAASAGRSRCRRRETARSSARPAPPRCRSIWRRPAHGGCRTTANDCRCRW